MIYKMAKSIIIMMMIIITILIENKRLAMNLTTQLVQWKYLRSVPVQNVAGGDPLSCERT